MRVRRDKPCLLSPYYTASAGPAEAPSSPRLSEETLERYRQSVVKPELGDYVCLNFVSNEARRPGTPIETKSRPITPLAEIHTVDREEKPEQGGDIAGGEGGERNADCVEEAETIWRSSSGRNRERQAEHNNLQDKGLENRISGSVGNTLESDTDNEQYDKDARLYPRTLGSSASVLDEKDAAARNAKFAGEDPVRGRLRATDPFQWIGCLHAGAASINGLVDQANATLQGISGSTTTSSTGGGSITVDSGTDLVATLIHCSDTDQRPNRFAVFLLKCRDSPERRFCSNSLCRFTHLCRHCCHFCAPRRYTQLSLM